MSSVFDIGSLRALYKATEDLEDSADINKVAAERQKCYAHTIQGVLAECIVAAEKLLLAFKKNY